MPLLSVYQQGQAYLLMFQFFANADISVQQFFILFQKLLTNPKIFDLQHTAFFQQFLISAVCFDKFYQALFLFCCQTASPHKNYTQFIRHSQ